jgi:hypothetical protein
MNRTACYERACRAVDHPVPKSVKQQASETFHKPRVQEAYRQACNERADRLGFRKDEVLSELRNMWEMDISQFMEERDVEITQWGSDGKAKVIKVTVLTARKLSELSVPQRRAIKAIKLVKGCGDVPCYEVELYDRMELNRLLMAHLGMTKESGWTTNNTQFVISIPGTQPASVDEWMRKFAPPE